MVDYLVKIIKKLCTNEITENSFSVFLYNPRARTKLPALQKPVEKTGVIKLMANNTVQGI